MKVERFEVFLIGKLIWLVLNWKIVRIITIYFFVKKGIALSPYKLYTTFRSYMFEFRTAVEKSDFNFLEEIIEISEKYHKSDKKKNSNNWSYEIISKFIGKKDIKNKK